MGNTYQGVRVRRKPYPEAVVELARGFEMRSAPFVEIRVRAQVLGHVPAPYTHLRAHETRHDLACRLLLEKKKKKTLLSICELAANNFHRACGQPQLTSSPKQAVRLTASLLSPSTHPLPLSPDLLPSST